MATFYIANAFSLNMLERGGFDLALRPIHIDGVKNLMLNHRPKSVVGHKETASILSTLLGWEVAHNRESLQLDQDGWSLIVAQYIGPRLPEGATALPDGATMEFWQVYPI